VLHIDHLNARALTNVMLDRLEADARPAGQQLPLQGDIASTAFWRRTEPPALLYVSPPERLEAI
jgi:hypothetical protein